MNSLRVTLSAMDRLITGKQDGIAGRGLAFLVCWFLAAVSISLSGWLDSVPSATLFTAGAVLGAGGYFALYFGFSSFRRLVLSLNLRTVTLVQSSRVTGGIFFLEYLWGRLPALFAVTTAATDVTVGITAFFVAPMLVSRGRRPKRGLLYWHVFGTLAALTSGALGVLTSGTELGLLAEDVTSQAMSTFPLNLVPLFLGPVTLIFHLIALCIILDTGRETSSAIRRGSANKWR
jgi:hypothetical protein